MKLKLLFSFLFILNFIKFSKGFALEPSGSAKMEEIVPGDGSSSQVRTYGMKEVIDMVEKLKSLFNDLELKVASIEAAYEEQRTYGLSNVSSELETLKSRVAIIEGRRSQEILDKQDFDSKIKNLEQTDGALKEKFTNFEKIILERILGVQTEITEQKNWTSTIFNDYCKIMLKPNDENKIYALTEVYDFCIQKVNFTQNSS